MMDLLYIGVTINGVWLAWQAVVMFSGMQQGDLSPVTAPLVVIPLVIGAACCLIVGFVGLGK